MKSSIKKHAVRAEVRQVLGVGGSFLICLPKHWLRERGIGAGDSLIVVANGELRLLPAESEAKRERRERKADGPPQA